MSYRASAYIRSRLDSRLSRSLSAVAAYRPFIIGILIVFGLTYVLALLTGMDGDTNAHQLMNSFMGCFFVVFALPKFFNLSAFMEAFRQYDLISQRFPAYARWFPVLELCLGLLLLSTITERSMLASFGVNVVVAAISGLGVYSVVRALRAKKDLACACMGATFKIPLSKIAVIENGTMLFMALAMLLVAQPAQMTMTNMGLMR